MMGYYEGEWGAGQWLSMSAVMLFVWGTVIALGVYAVSASRDGRRREGATDAGASRADSVLAERFARGEIDEDEFLHRRELLHATAAPPVPLR